MTKKYYGVFDAEGKPQGFYVDDVYPPDEDGNRNAAIPAAAVEITEAVWTEMLEGQPFTRYLNGAVTHITPPPPPPPPENPLEKRIAAMEKQIEVMAEVLKRSTRP